MKFKRGYYDVFMKTCAKNPSSIAVRQYKNGLYKHYTYSELYGVCEYISQNLLQLKCNKGIIGLLAERNIIIPCLIAAAHKCCTTFMFLDPSKNIESIIEEIKLSIIIIIQEKQCSTSSDLFSRKADKTVSVFDLDIKFYDIDQPGSSKNFPEHSFIAMTSGSTGDPKHIQVPVQCIQPNIDDLTKLFRITSNDIIYFSTPLTFDPSMIEILLAFTNGASLLIAPEKAGILFPNDRENSVTFWQTTPSKFFQHSDADIKNKILSANSTLKILALGGEPLNGVKRLRELKDWNNKTKIFTLYGVTEMSCWACAAELDLNRIHTDKEVPLGECLSETQIYVETQPDQSKETGKIILVSKSRKCVILNKSKGNQEENSLKVIDTGDLGEVKNGTIYYRGRKDDIIKRFGHKINLQFIERTIMLCPKVKTCSCVWLPTPLLLVVYFSSETLSSQDLSNFLKCKLDDKHWPDKIVRVDSLPTNSHGKISRVLLSKMYEQEESAPHTLDTLRINFLKELKAVMSGNFTYEQIKDKDFFSIGGTSFLAVIMCNKLSLFCPKFGKFILPYLMSHKNTIDDIIKRAHKEVCVDHCKPKRRTKRSRSEQGDMQSQIMKKLNSNTNPAGLVVLWSFDTGKCVDASPTLFQIRSNLYTIVGSHSGKLVVLDAITGILKSMISLKARIEASVFCCFDKPATTPCGIVGAYDGTILCFAIENCKALWRINVKSMIKSKATCCNGRIYIASYDGKVRCIDIMTGTIIDTIHIADHGISADLVLAKNEYVLLGTLSGVCASIHTGANTVAWRCSLGSPVFASPVIYDHDKFVVFAEVKGEIHCRTVEKGIKIWKYTGAQGNIFSSIFIKEVDKLKWEMIFGCHDNNVYCISLKNFQPSLHWRAQLTSPVYSTPCSFGDKFILAASNNGTLCILDLKTGVTLAEHKLPGETFSSPVTYEDYLYIGCRDDNIYSLKCGINL